MNKALNVILLANQPRIFRELLHRALDSAPSPPLVVEMATTDNLRRILERVKARWLIVTAQVDGTIPTPVVDLVAQHPELAVAAVSPDGSHLDVLESESSGERKRYTRDDITLADLFLLLAQGTSQLA